MPLVNFLSVLNMGLAALTAAIGLYIIVFIFRCISNRSSSSSLDADHTIDRYKIAIDQIELTASQKQYIETVFFHDLRQAILGAKRYRTRFWVIARAPICLTAMVAVVTVLSSGLLSGLSAYGLTAIGVIAAVQGVIVLIERLEQNGAGWKDASALKYALQESIEELLSVTPEIPLDAQYRQFETEYRQLRQLKQQQLDRRIDTSQAAAKMIVDDALSKVQDSRDRYHDQHAVQPPETPPRQTPATEESPLMVGETDITVARYIALSTPDNDEDSAIFVGQ